MQLILLFRVELLKTIYEKFDFAFAILFVVVSCNKEEDLNSKVNRIVIKGNISGNNLKSTGLKSNKFIIAI